LLLGKPYRHSVKETLRRGGDTDTNCCIVGGIMGAYHGLSKLPADAVHKVLTCEQNTPGERMNRPDFVNPAKGSPQLIEQLLLLAPSELILVNKAETPSVTNIGALLK